MKVRYQAKSNGGELSAVPNIEHVKERNAGVSTFEATVRSCVSLMNCMTNCVGTAPGLGWAATM